MDARRRVARRVGVDQRHLQLALARGHGDRIARGLADGELLLLVHDEAARRALAGELQVRTAPALVRAREVVARVRARLRQTDGALSVLRAGDLEMDTRRREVRAAGRAIELTPTEFALLQVFMEQPGYVLTREELVRRGLGLDFEGVERTLDSHIRNLRHKLGPDPAALTYIQTVYGVGYRLVEGAP